MFASPAALPRWSILGCLAVSLVEAIPLSHHTGHEELVGHPRPGWDESGAGRALVLGGTGFMGRWIVDRLLKEGFNVTIFNRGKTPNPWPADQVSVLKADRYQEREKFSRMLNQSGAWEVVIDETAFHENFIHDLVTALAIPGRHNNDPTGGFRFKHYIYLSSDSIYWQLKMPDDDNPVNESSPKRFHPDEEKPHRKYLKLTEHGRFHAGHAKDQMTCDTFLHQMFTAFGFPYTSLRLPDVYGPYNQDTENGFWNIVMTVQQAGKLAAKYPPGRIRPRGSREAVQDHSKYKATWAFVGDVADALVAVIKAGREHELPIGEQYKKEGPFGEVFHIGHEEAVSLEELSNIIFNVGKESPVVSGQFGANGATLNYEEDAVHPATDFGALDVSKAKHYLKFEPTPIREAVQVSLEWYFGDQQSLPRDIARHKEL